MGERLTEYQVDIVRGWARDHKRAGLDEADAVRRCCLYHWHEGHTREVVADVYQALDARKGE